MMNPLKLAAVTLAGATALSVTPYLIKKATAKESSTRTEVKANAPLALAELPVETAPSLLSSSRADAESFAPTAELELKPSPAPAVSAPAKQEVAVAPAPAPVAPQPEKAALEIAPVEKVVASLPAPSIKVNLPTPSAYSAPATAAAIVAAVATPKVEISFSADVKAAQEHLEKLGVTVGKIDGKLGPKTQAAIAEFQKKSGLAGDGHATKDTLVKMEEAVAALPKVEVKAVDFAPATDSSKAQFVIIEPSRPKRDAGPVPSITKVADVKRLQETLAAAKFYEDKPDGKWGKKTITAVETFQKKNKLKVTGKPDEATWKKLNQVIAAKWETRPAKNVTPASEVAKAENTKDAASPAAAEAEAKLVSAPKAVVNIASPIVVKEEAAPAPAPARDEELKISAPETVDEQAAQSAEVKPEAAAPEAVAEANEPQPLVPKVEEPAVVAAVAETVKVTEPVAKVPAETLEISKPAEESETVVADAAAPAETKVEAAAAEAPAPPATEVAAAPAVEPETVTIAEPTVLHVNADAGEKAQSAIATPAIVSAEVKTPAPADENTVAVTEPAPVVAQPIVPAAEAEKLAEAKIEQPVEVAKTEAPKTEVPKVEPETIVAAPAEPAPAVNVPAEKIVAAKPTASVSTEIEAPGASLREREAALETEMERAQAAVSDDSGMVSHSKPMIISKSSAQVVEPLDSLVQKVDRNLDAKSADGTQDVGAAKEQLEQVKIEALRKKAEAKVNDVEDTYKELKTRFADQVKKGQLVDTMAKIDNGFTAMKADFKKGNYQPIVDRCDGFKLAIEMLANDAAKLYVETTLEKKNVREKLSKSDVKEIEQLCGKNKFVEAANQLDKVARKSESKRS